MSPSQPSCGIPQRSKNSYSSFTIQVQMILPRSWTVRPRKNDGWKTTFFLGGPCNFSRDFLLSNFSSLRIFPTSIWPKGGDFQPGRDRNFVKISYQRRCSFKAFKAFSGIFIIETTSFCDFRAPLKSRVLSLTPNHLFAMEKWREDHNIHFGCVWT